MRTFKKQCTALLACVLLSSSHYLYAMENPLQNFPKQEILVKKLKKHESIKFVSILVDELPVFCLLNTDGAPEFFAITLQYGPKEFACMTMFTPRAKALMDLFTKKGKQPLFNQKDVRANVPEYYLSLSENDVFKCPASEHDMLWFVYKNDWLIKDSGMNLTCKSVSERWDIFHKVLQLCLAVKNADFITVDKLGLDPSSIQFIVEMSAFKAMIKNHLP